MCTYVRAYMHAHLHMYLSVVRGVLYMSCDCCQMTTLQVFRNETLWLGLDLHTDHLTDPQAERNRNKEKRKKHNYYFKRRLTKYED